MSTHTTISTITLRGGAAALAALALAVSAAPAQVVIQRSDDEGNRLFAQSRSIQVSIDDGDVKVVLDGQEIPQDRIRREDGKIVILDENGQEIHTMPAIRWGGDNDVWAFVGDEVMAGGPGFMAMAADPPPVMLGLTMSRPERALEVHLGLEPGASTMITGVYKGLPAERAGLGEFDIIVDIDGDEPADPAAVRQALQELEDGDRITFGVIHEGRQRDVTIEVAAYDAQRMREAEYIGSAARGVATWFGPGGQGFTFESLKGLEGLKDLKTFNKGFNDFFVVPGEKENELFVPHGKFDFQLDMDRFKDQMEEARRRMEEAQRDWHQKGGAGGPDAGPVDGRMSDLDRRMEALEKLLDRLLEKIDEAKK